MPVRWILLLALLWPATARAEPLDHWLAYGGGPLPPSWQIAGGVITHNPGGGDIETEDQYADFELDFDWQVSPGGNSGVFYRVPDGHGADDLAGPEYQVLDNAGHPDGRNPLTSAASAYGIYAPDADRTRPAGEWNSARILVEGNHVEHWLNGALVLSYELGSPDWRARVAASKFAGTAYGTAPRGHIVLQDHGAAVAFRNLAITPLP